MMFARIIESHSCSTIYRLFVEVAVYTSVVPLLLLLLLIIISITPVVRAQLGEQLFKPLTPAGDESTACAVDEPSAVASIAAILGFPDGVPESVKCGFVCAGFSGCVGFNHRNASNWSNGEGQCELYTFSPHNCTTNETSCRYFHQVVKCSSCVRMESSINRSIN